MATRTTIWSLIALNLEGGLPAAADHILPLAVSIGGPLWILTQAAVLRLLLPHGTISCTGKTDAFVERTSIDSVALEGNVKCFFDP